MKTTKQFLVPVVLISVTILVGYVCAESIHKEFKTSTGKKIFVTEKHPNGLSLSTIEIRSSGFDYNLDQTIEDSDPIKEVIITDLDNNGFDELYIITVSSGSGSYGNVLAFASNRDKSLSRINFPEFQEGAKIFEGYMGHSNSQSL